MYTMFVVGTPHDAVAYIESLKDVAYVNVVYRETVKSPGKQILFEPRVSRCKLVNIYIYPSHLIDVGFVASLLSKMKWHA